MSVWLMAQHVRMRELEQSAERDFLFGVHCINQPWTEVPRTLAKLVPLVLAHQMRYENTNSITQLLQLKIT